MSENTYGQDLEFLRKHTEIIELAASDDARVAVAPFVAGDEAGGPGNCSAWTWARFRKADTTAPPCPAAVIFLAAGAKSLILTGFVNPLRCW